MQLMQQEDASRIQKMAENKTTEKKTIWKVNPRTVKRLQREALVKRLQDGRKTAQEASDNSQPLPLSLDESEQGMDNISSSSSDAEVDMDESGITAFSTPSKEEEALAYSPEKGNCIILVRLKASIP